MTIPDSVTNIGCSVFSGCTSLERVKISNSVTSIGCSVFSGCTSLERVKIPNSVTGIGCSVFSGCTSLERVKIPNSVTSIGDDAFYDCTALEVTVPDMVEDVSIDAFKNVKNVKYQGNLGGAPWGAKALNGEKIVTEIEDDEE